MGVIGRKSGRVLKHVGQYGQAQNIAFHERESPLTSVDGAF